MFTDLLHSSYFSLFLIVALGLLLFFLDTLVLLFLKN